MLFLGRHDYSMDERGRVPIPPKFREALVRGVILTYGTPDHCVRAYPADTFEEQANLFLNEPGMGRQGRVLRRALFARAYPAELDRQGRVLVPPPLRRFAGLEGSVVVVGTGEFMEIWDSTSFDETLTEEEEEFELAVENIVQLKRRGDQQ